jgi:hypothetical protein
MLTESRGSDAGRHERFHISNAIATRMRCYHFDEEAGGP